MVWLIILLCRILCLVLPLLISVAYLTLIERKVIASIQRRKGPNVIGFLAYYNHLQMF